MQVIFGIGEDRLRDRCSSASPSTVPVPITSLVIAGRLERRLDALGALDGVGELRELDRQQAMVAGLEPVLLDHPLADDVAGGDEVLADEGLAGVALGVLRDRRCSGR